MQPDDRPLQPGSPPAYPPLPSAPPERRRSIAAPVLIGLFAGLFGAVLGSVLGLVAVDRRFAARDAVQTRPPEQVAAPTVEVLGGEDIDRVAAVAAAVVPSVVQVNVEGDAGLGHAVGNGSGVIYRSDGHIVTNHHVVARAESLQVVFSDGASRSAQVVGTDPETDLAVIKVGRAGLPAIAVGDARDLRVGQLAVAIGSPFGLEGSVTSGVISATNRPITVTGSDGRELRLQNVIQTDASINPGNSGGALVTADGRLVGINSAILTRDVVASNAGVGFAIPVNTVVQIADELIAQGFVLHPFLGVAGRNIDPELAERLGVEEGAYVESVEPGTPAATAGLRNGDVVIRVDGDDVTSMDDLIVAVRRRVVGDTIRVTYIRDGARQTVTVSLAEKPR